MKTITRKSLPLTAVEAGELSALRVEGTPERNALFELMPEDMSTSEAAILRAVFTLGRQRLHEHMLERGYAAERDEENDEDRAARAMLRFRLLASSVRD